MRHPLAAMTLFLLTIWLVPHVRAAGFGANVGADSGAKEAPGGQRHHPIERLSLPLLIKLFH